MTDTDRTIRLGALAAALVLTACASSGDPGTTVASVATTTTQPTSTTTIVATTSTSPAAAVPEELAGSWRTQTDDPSVERICLGMGANNYSHSVCGGTSIGGTLSFEGDTVTFTSKMEGCPDGVGVYRWALDGESLTFTELDPPDECDIRRDHLDGQIFSR